MENLIKEYKLKIEACDKEITLKTQQIRECRNSCNTEDWINMTADFAEDRRIINTRRQCYVQFVVDMEGQMEYSQAADEFERLGEFYSGGNNLPQ